MKSLLNRCRLVSEQLCIFGPKVLLQASPKQFSIVPVHRLNIYFVFMNDFTLLVWRQVFFPICKLMNSVLSRENSILSVQLIILLLIAVMQSGWYGSSFQPSYQNFQNLVGCWDDGSVSQQAHNCLNSSGTAMNDLPMNDLPCDGTAFEYLADGIFQPICSWPSLQSLATTATSSLFIVTTIAQSSENFPISRELHNNRGASKSV